MLLYMIEYSEIDWIFICWAYIDTKLVMQSLGANVAGYEGESKEQTKS